MADIALQHEIEQFVYHEAFLLEERRFDEWLGLLTADVQYLVPNRRSDGELAVDGVILRADLAVLQSFVKRLTNPLSPPQRPMPRAQYFISNVILGAREGDELPLRSSLIVYIGAADREPSHHPAISTYRLRRLGPDWKIARKTIALLANNRSLGQLPLL